MIPFNRPYIIGRELDYIRQAVASGKLSGNGQFTQRCHAFFRERYGFPSVLLTSSCTDALEMCGLLLNLSPGDEIIIPSYTFVSTANAFLLRGARIRFADSQSDHPNIDHTSLAELINDRTRAIVVVHYNGTSCWMDEILEIAAKRNILVVEDCAQALESKYKGRPLGSLGAFSTYSFHETKNVVAGEGGLLVVNNTAYAERAEIIWEKGTNRAAFARGEVQKYLWVDVGSSYLPSELTAAFLYAQLEHVDQIQNQRVMLWNRYFERLSVLERRGDFKLLHAPPFATSNAHLMAIICPTGAVRDKFLEWLRSKEIYAVFHYLPLHLSPYYAESHDGRELPNSVRFADCLVRLPLFYELTLTHVDYICDCVDQYFSSQR